MFSETDLWGRIWSRMSQYRRRFQKWWKAHLLRERQVDSSYWHNFRPLAQSIWQCAWTRILFSGMQLAPATFSASLRDSKIIFRVIFVSEDHPDAKAAGFIWTDGYVDEAGKVRIAATSTGLYANGTLISKLHFFTFDHARSVNSPASYSCLQQRLPDTFRNFKRSQYPENYGYCPFGKRGTNAFLTSRCRENL